MTDQAQTTAPRSQWRDVWVQFRAHRGALVGMVVFLTIIATVFIGPLLWPLDATYIDILDRNQGPSWKHPFGTDQLGRDTLARMKADYVYPAVADRRSPDEWEADGALDIRARARIAARQILATPRPPAIPPEIDEAIRAEFNILLSREAVGRG